MADVTDETAANTDQVDGKLKDLKVSGSYLFLNDDHTVKFIRSSNVLFIMRGLPGSGKSTVVEHLKQTYPDIVVCSADSFFFREDGTYFRDDSRLSEVHDRCQAKALEAMKDNKPVVVDNTNVRYWEMQKYFGYARQNGYITLVVIPDTPWAFDPVELAQRNSHGVPLAHIEAKKNAFDEAIPYYYGWFLNRTDSDWLKTLGIKYFNDCLNTISEFSLFLSPNGIFLNFLHQL